MTQIAHETGNQSKERYFSELSATPFLSWPSILLFIFGVSVLVGGGYLAIIGAIPYWVASITGGIGLYFLFSVMHEALHGSVSSNNFINNSFGRVSLMLMIPMAPLEIARWVHLRHHAFTTTDKDPDHFMHDVNFFDVLIRWGNFDFYYFYYFLKNGGNQVQRHRLTLSLTMLVFVSIVATAIAMGYGLELLLLWFLPSRIGLALVAFIFVFLPHYPADISTEEDRFKATTVRKGHEWLLTPLMVYQNYHLIHHIYPNAPFYNYLKIWHLKYEELTAREPAVQEGFSLLPKGRTADSVGKGVSG